MGTDRFYIGATNNITPSLLLQEDSG